MVAFPSISANRHAGHSVLVTTSANDLRDSKVMALISVKYASCLVVNVLNAKVRGFAILYLQIFYTLELACVVGD